MRSVLPEHLVKIPSQREVITFISRTEYTATWNNKRAPTTWRQFPTFTASKHSKRKQVGLTWSARSPATVVSATPSCPWHAIHWGRNGPTAHAAHSSWPSRVSALPGSSSARVPWSSPCAGSAGLTCNKARIQQSLSCSRHPPLLYGTINSPPEPITAAHAVISRFILASFNIIVKFTSGFPNVRTFSFLLSY